ncbi:hypothetical protein BGC07_01505 [Piscirickettsia litoralis]|uniref:HTH araC/xylS-type domain-containing protein n=1 Tax=Piscirickettsia litoralis TaxID=1891921 RepID=A0ABX3A967_9GAMM|nr:hypothetical protein BGC07_01505 [Piscirickettsia litoralis]
MDLEDSPAQLLGIAVDSEENSSMHQHQRAQLLYAIDGTMLITTNSQVSILPPTKAAWIPPQTPHQGKTHGILKSRNLYFNTTYFNNLPQVPQVINVTPLLRELIKRACEFPITQTLNSVDLRLASVIVDEIIRAEKTPYIIPLPQDKRAKKATEILMQHTDQSLSIQTIAKNVGTSSRTLTRLFKKETGMNFSQWHQQLKLIRSIEFLSTTRSVTQTAQLLGFSSDSAFITMFKRLTGETPSQYIPH